MKFESGLATGWDCRSVCLNTCMGCSHVIPPLSGKIVGVMQLANAVCRQALFGRGTYPNCITPLWRWLALELADVISQAVFHITRPVKSALHQHPDPLLRGRPHDRGKGH